MTVKNFIYTLCIKNGMTQTEMANNLGVSKSNLYNALNRDDGMNMRLSTFIDWLDNIDCQLFIEDLNSDEEYYLDGLDDGTTMKI